MRKSTKHEQSPAFQFYASDWISEPVRLTMSLEEQGAYILLLCHCWRGYQIKFDYEVLARMCNCSLDKIKKMWPKIAPMFVEDNGYLRCIQADEERSVQKKYRKAKSKAGKKGAIARWSNE